MPQEWTRRVQGLMQARGIGPGQLATYTGLSRGTVYLWQRNPDAPVTPLSVEKVAHFAGWPLEAALEWAAIKPVPTGDPLADLHRALYRGPWHAGVRDALWELAQATAAAPPQTQVLSEEEKLQALEAWIEHGPWDRDLREGVLEFVRLVRGGRAVIQHGATDGPRRRARRARGG